ncbi:hypothetical protein [Halolamina rubra]|uniref:hypothetical protein n=1 Tax=Halolamina rubra TaxID=1380430 RepID=UPI0006799770|nr:hypothetical protein [Halolamina rubra]
MEVERDGDGVRAVDEAKTTVRVAADGWTPTATAPALDPPVDAAVTGRTDRLEFPPAFVSVTEVDSGESTTMGGREGPISFPAGAYELRIAAPVRAYVRVDGAFSLAQPEFDRLVVSFPEPTAVRLGFRSRTGSAQSSVTVPRTPAGVATALSAFPAACQSTTADRSFSSMRTRPPRLRFGDRTEIPDSVREEIPDTGIELRLPRSLASLLPAAPLAHYLGADVSVADDADPTLRAAGERIGLGTGRAYERRVASLLRRTFWLDCLVRTAGPYDANTVETDLLDDLAIDADALYDASIAERLLAYREVDLGAIEPELPEWHLSLYVEPTEASVRCLPHLLEDVPQLFTPRSSPLSDEDRLDSSLSAFYRDGEDAPEPVALRNADLGPSRYHGWLADGVALDTFKSLPAAYENRSLYRERADEAISVVAVLNESEMSEEHSRAAEIYRRRAERLNIDIDVRESLSTAELARTIERHHDLLHFVGHCEASGLRCPDGTLSVSSVERSRAQTFFLNACGSYEEGKELVRKGSVAGGVTFEKVLDSHAAKVGTMFARLVVHGYAIERALELARRRVIMGKDYAVVGDGTHVLAQTETVVGSQAELTRTEDGFSLTYGMLPPARAGARAYVNLDRAERPMLLGNERTFEMDAADLVPFLRRGEFPVIYRGDIRWSSALADDLARGRIDH